MPTALRLLARRGGISVSIASSFCAMPNDRNLAHEASQNESYRLRDATHKICPRGLIWLQSLYSLHERDPWPITLFSNSLSQQRQTVQTPRTRRHTSAVMSRSKAAWPMHPRDFNLRPSHLLALSNRKPVSWQRWWKLFFDQEPPGEVPAVASPGAG